MSTLASIVSILGAIGGAAALLVLFFRQKSELEDARKKLLLSAAKLAERDKRLEAMQTRAQNTMRQLIQNAASLERQKAEIRIREEHQKQEPPETMEGAEVEAREMAERAKRSLEILESIDAELKK